MDSFRETAPAPDATSASARLISGGRALGAFLVLAALLVVIALFARGKDHAPASPTQQARSATVSLTNSEAIAKFKELNRLRIRAYKERDLSLVPLAFVADSAPARTATREIRFLLRRRVLAKPHFHTLALSVQANHPDSVRIRQSVVVDGRFSTESGKNVTAPSRPKRQTINWVLSRDGSEWKISSSVVVEAVPIGDHG
jgi:hypothetical protein